MKTREGIDLDDVRAVYSGPEGDLWELVMGEQIHIGGFASSQRLAERAGIAAGQTGVDLCCCTGAGMRWLVRFRGVARMIGVDATERMVQRGRQRVADEGLSDRIEFVEAEATRTGLPDASADFVWGEDAWCYVADRPGLIAEAARITRPGGVVAFTDWVEGPAGLSDQQAARLLTFMRFPSVQDFDGYRALLRDTGLTVKAGEDTGQFAPHVDLYIQMLQMQLTYDALKVIDFDTERMEGLAGEMAFLQELAHEGRIAQGLFVARKP